MISVVYKNAMAEVLHYLKGINPEDVKKISKKFMSYLEENASKDYECNFDYTMPLKDLQLLDETKGIISIICLNYWCQTQEQKDAFINNMNENERIYQEKLSEKYNPDTIFANNKLETKVKEDLPEVNIVLYEESIIKKIIKKIIGLLRKAEK